MTCDMLVPISDDFPVFGGCCGVAVVRVQGPQGEYVNACGPHLSYLKDHHGSNVVVVGEPVEENW